jgi:hypothetical protein
MPHHSITGDRTPPDSITLLLRSSKVWHSRSIFALGVSDKLKLGWQDQRNRRCG